MRSKLRYLWLCLQFPLRLYDIMRWNLGKIDRYKCRKPLCHYRAWPHYHRVPDGFPGDGRKVYRP